MLTRFAHSELPYPRVRDARGHTAELRRFLTRRYGRYVCPEFLDGCGCRDCRFDSVWTAPWSGSSRSLWEEVPDVPWSAPVLFVEEGAAESTRLEGRLEELLGRPLGEVGAVVRLLDDGWSERMARRQGDVLRAQLVRRLAAGEPCPGRLVLLGRRVGTAFRRPEGELLRWAAPDGVHVAVAPHPSRRAPWWNSAANRARARAFFRELVEGVWS